MYSVMRFKAGDIVEVRSQQEILATLDSRGCLENVHFMPEMLDYCGKRFRVYKRADKTCDPVHSPWSIRRVERSVHLEGARCNGAGHGGCQAGCLIFWKEDWLKPIESSVVPVEDLQPAPALPVVDAINSFDAIERVTAASRTKDSQGETAYFCQATELQRFSSYMRWWDPRQYIRDLRSRNLRSSFASHSRTEQALEFMLGIIQVLRAFVLSFFREYRHLNYPFVAGTQIKTRTEALDLQPGELVQVLSKDEILATLDKGQRNRGLWFDAEMLPYCGGIYRVLRRVHQIIDEKTGKMVVMKNPCIVLEGVVCKSDFNRLCPRAIYPYWREIWLKRAANIQNSSLFTKQLAETCEKP